MIRTMDAYWLEQTEADVPAGNHWLSAGEQFCLGHLRFEKRRTDWRLGRWTAKRAVASFLNLPTDDHFQDDIEIRAMPSGAPEVFLFNQKAGVSLSLSHRAGKALCVVGLSKAALGCDLEVIERRDPSFVTDFFTANEQRLIHRSPPDAQPMLATLLWSAKESALKALRVGLRLNTTSLDVSFTDDALIEGKYSRQDDCAVWSPLLLRCNGGKVLRGCWRCANDVVRTVVFNPSETELRC